MDEKQLQFLFNEYAKGKGFKDFSEFKGLMDSEPSRKMFFEESNKELGFKDYNEFNDLLGLKKKVSGVASVPTESKSALPGFLEEGKKMAQVGFATPQILSEDVKARKRPSPGDIKDPKIRISPKLFGTPGVVDVDLVEADDDGSYKNLAQNLANNFLISASDIGAGLAQILREGAPTGVPREKKKTEALYTPEGEKTKYAETVTWAQDPLARVALGLNGISEPAKEMQQTVSGKLPDTFLGNTLTSLSAIVPDLAATALMPEAKAVQGASFLQKTGSLLFNNFTKYLMVKEPLVGYNQAKLEGKDQSAVEVLSNVGKGAIAGMELALLGAGSGLATKATMKQAAKIGLVGTKGFAAKELVNLATDVVAYGLISPSIHTLYKEGRFPTSKEISEGAGIALAFRLKDAIPSISTFRDLNKAVDNIQQAKQGAALYNFLQATPESIVRVYNGKESANELHLKAMVAAKEAKDAVDPIEKQKAVIKASTMAKAANVKQMADMFVQDKGLIDVIKNNQELPVEAKLAIAEKAEIIRKAVDPVEIQKEQAAQRMQQGQKLIQDLTLEMNGEQDPVRKAELKFRIEQTEKGLKMQENGLMSLIEGQSKEGPLDLTDVNTVKQSRKAFNEQMDLKLEALDKNDPDYFEKVENFNKQREERNDYFDRVIEDKKQDEKGISVMTPEEFNQVENIEVSLEGQKAEAPVEEIVAEVKPADIETKKADILKRRNEELASVPGLSLDMTKEENQKLIDRTNEIIAKYDAELKALEEVKPTELKELGKKSVEELEKRQAEIEDAKTGTPEREEFNKIDKELEEREWRSVFDAPIEKVSDVVDAIMKKEKEMPNGFGSYMEPRDARLTKDVANRYSKENASRLTDAEVIKDFKDAMFGSPMDSYADGLKLREAIKQARERGINVFEELSKEFVKDGYSKQDAIDMAKRKLEPFLKSIEPAKEVKKIESKVEAPKQQVDQENRSYTTKSGRQKVEYENGQLIVKDVKTGKEVSDVTRRKAIDEYIENFDFNKGERFYEVVTELPSGLNEEEGKRFIVENSKNPLEVVEIYAAEPKESKLTTEEQMIADYGLGKLKQAGFERFGDENLITGGMARTYFNKEGMPIDVVAKEMSDYYEKEITPQDIIDFMVAYPSGASQAVRMGETRVAKEAAARFQELTGIDLNSKVAERIIDAEIAKAEAFEQELIKQEYETREQLEEEYYRASAEADRLAEEGNRPAAQESEKTGAVEAKKEVTLQDIYENLPKSEKLRNKQIESIVNRDFESIIKQLEKYKEC